MIEGIKINHLTFNGVIVEKLYLKWDNALLISASKIDLNNLKNNNTPITLKPLSKLPTLIKEAQRWVKQIDINTIQYDNISVSLHYLKNSSGVLTIQKSIYKWNGTFSLTPEEFNLTVPSSSFEDANISAILSIKLAEQKLKAKVSVLLPDTPEITIFALGNNDTIDLNIKTLKELTTLKPLVRLLKIDTDIEPWIVKYAKASYFRLNSLEGKFHYDHPEELIQNIHADATVIRGEYTFAQGFEPIKSPQINLIFENGKLYISPINGTFYTLPTEKSNLNIDFTTPHTMLNIAIKTANASLNDPILKLLNFYKIYLPIKQTVGSCNVDLNLSVNLYTYDTTAKGTFIPSSSELLLDQTPLRSEGGIVYLDNSKVLFKNFIAHYGENVANAEVNGQYDASNKHGNVMIDAYEVIPDKKHLYLYNRFQPLHVIYTISPTGDSLEVMPSVWNFIGETLHIDSFSAPFDYHNATASIQAVGFNLSDKIHGKINAIFNGSKKNTSVQIHLNDFDHEGIKLISSPFTLNLQYNQDNLILSTSDTSSWIIHQLPTLISPFSATLIHDNLAFENIEIVLGDLLKGNFSGQYHLNTQKGTIQLNNMLPINPKMQPIIDAKTSLVLSLDASNNELILDSEALNGRFATMENGWKISLNDISLLANKSPILRRYNIDKGNLNIYYTGESSRYTFDGIINYPYALMIINNQPISLYRFSGTSQEGKSTIRVNNRLLISRTEKEIDIKANNTGINLPQFIKFLSVHKPDTKSTSEASTNDSLPVRIHAANTYLYLMKDRKIVADNFDALLQDDTMDASLQHMGGSAVLKIRKGLFYIDGYDFNDKFMEHLFTLSDFIGGKFSFEAKGEFESFDGIMRVENTILKDYKVLNNVLAFVNTIPSLTTFSLPNYNTKGLPVKEGYAHFAYQNDNLHVDNFTLNSPEIKIFGQSNADMKNQTLNGELTLKTDLGSKLGKVPMVGYILFGEDGSLSTTVTLSGKLDNPKVETAIAKEIVTAPFNILKRTLVFPFLWMMDDKKKK